LKPAQVPGGQVCGPWVCRQNISGSRRVLGWSGWPTRNLGWWTILLAVAR